MAGLAAPLQAQARAPLVLYWDAWVDDARLVVLNAVDAVIVRLLSPDVHPFVIGFSRALFGFLAVLPWMLSRPGILRSHYLSRYGDCS